MARRALLRSGLALPFLPALLGRAAAAVPDDQPEVLSTLGKNEWIDKALSLPPARGTPGATLQTGRFRDPFYFLTSPISWRPGPGDPPGLPQVIVPKGFVTDFASIPEKLFSFLRPDGDYVYAAVLHDYLYWEQTTDRDTADIVLRTVMRDFEVAPMTVKAIYLGVHLAGNAAWLGNGAARKRGEKRVLREFPTDPRTTWGEWKLKPNVLT
jgi:hypothetical protein